MAAPPAVTDRPATPWPARIAASVGAAAALGILVLTARSGGGYFPVEYLTTGVAALVAAAVVLAVAPATHRPTRRAAVALGALLAFAAWNGLSGSWSPAPDAAAAAFQRNAAYAAVLLLGVVLAGRRRGASALALTVWLGLTGIALAGAVSRLLPTLELAPLRDSLLADGRLSWPVTYWNAQGLAAAMALLLGLGIAADRRAHVVLRGVAAAVVPLTAVALVLTLSRGSVAALAIGLVVLLLLSPHPLRAVAVLVVTAAPTAVVVAACVAEPAVIEPLGRTSDLETVGPRILVAAVVCGAVAAGLAIFALRTVKAWERARRRRRSTRNGPVSVAAAILTVVLVAGVAVGAARFDDRIAEGTVQARTFLDARGSEFSAARPNTALGAERLGSASGSRSDAYRVAIDEFQSAPLVGAGTGTYPLLWLRERRGPETIRNAHSLPLETAGETGLVGIGLLLLFAGAVTAGAIAMRRRPGPLPRARAAGGSAALAAFVASCCVDWTWQMGTLTAAAMLLAAIAVRDPRTFGRAG